MTDNDARTDAVPKPFRFKDEANNRDGSAEEGEARRHRKRRHHRHHRSRRDEDSSHHRSERSRRANPDTYDFTRKMETNDAFRESLFDAMGDDEGATFWEGVYGQPIHNYPNQFVNPDTGELENMTEEEYTQFVRRKMWEKSREGIEAAREEKRQKEKQEKTDREQTRQRSRTTRAAQEDGQAYNNSTFDFEVEASLRRSRQRKDTKRWRVLWQVYLRRWDDLQEMAKTRDSTTPPETNLFLRNQIAWPVESGQRKDLTAEEIERFVENAAGASEDDDEAKTIALVAALKAERVRWHPDKIQQRYGFMEIDDLTMKAVTATFQVLDRMWNDLRKTKE